jgi:hypothetical protein
MRFSTPTKILHEAKCAWSHAPTKSFNGVFCRGQEEVFNPRVDDGGVTGETDTDYFYFLCPGCKEVLQWHLIGFAMGPSRIPLKKEMCIPHQHLEVEIYCRKCKLAGIIKINNDCWQGGGMR